MTKGEAGKNLNAMLELVDALSVGLSNLSNSRTHGRLNTIRDQVMLLALDLGLPIQPVVEKADVQAERRPGDPG